MGDELEQCKPRSAKVVQGGAMIQEVGHQQYHGIRRQATSISCAQVVAAQHPLVVEHQRLQHRVPFQQLAHDCDSKAAAVLFRHEADVEGYLTPSTSKEGKNAFCHCGEGKPVSELR